MTSSASHRSPGESHRSPIWPALLIAGITTIIQLVSAAYVYGQLSERVAAHTDAIGQMRSAVEKKLDASVYYREHPRVEPFQGR